jgi:hypothetical protein
MSYNVSSGNSLTSKIDLRGSEDTLMINWIVEQGYKVTTVNIYMETFTS